MQDLLQTYSDFAAPNFSSSSLRFTALLTGGTGTFNLLDFAFFIAGTIVLFYLIIGGWEVMMSRGDPKAVGAGRVRITHAVVGLIIVVLAYVLVRLLGQILGAWRLYDFFQ